MEHPAYSQLRPVTANVGVVLAPNPSYAALEGTNTWIVRGPEDSTAVVIDVGPSDEGHLNVVNTKATQNNGTIALTLLSDRFDERAAGAKRFYQITGSPVRAVDITHNYGGAKPLEDGEFITFGGLTPAIEVVKTPGHSSDSVCFFIHSEGRHDDSDLEAIITGNTIAGRHTTMISESDGDLEKYLETLRMLEKRGKDVPLLPSHGPDHADLSAIARKYIDRRELRLRQVKEALAEFGEDVTVSQLVDHIYTDVDPVLRSAAEQSTRVTLRYLNR